MQMQYFKTKLTTTSTEFLYKKKIAFEIPH